MMEKLLNSCRSKTTEQIVLAIEMIGGGTVTPEACLVRCALLRVYAERMGETAADAMMDRLGM